LQPLAELRLDAGDFVLAGWRPPTPDR